MWQFCSERGKSVRRMELIFEIDRLSRRVLQEMVLSALLRKIEAVELCHLKQAKGTYGRE
jgi:hypothetical protein